MRNFTYYTPTEVCFGKGQVSRTGELIKKYGGTRVLIHYGSERVVKTGLIKKITDQLDELGIAYTLLGGVVPNPRISKVREGIALSREFGVDFLLGVGGGSVMDSCKAIGYGLANEGDVWDYYEHTRKPEKGFPVGGVLTISATGSVMSDSSVITAEELGEKRGCNSNLCRMRFAVMDPELTFSVDKYQTACGSTDIMMHTLERYLNGSGSMDITDELGEGLLRNMMKHTEVVMKDPENYESRAEIMWCEALSHNGLTGCGSDGGDWVCHKMEHEIGALYDVAHGAGLAAIWGTWSRYVAPYIPERFYKLAVNVMDVLPVGEADIPVCEIKGNYELVKGVIEEGICRMEEFFSSIGMPTSITGLGVNPTEEDLRHMARGTLLAVSSDHMGNTRTLYEEDLYNIFKAAL